jgi:hypothetical protein
MHKKLIMTCMAIAAFAAFVVAPGASASPVLTSSGVKVAVGTSITGKNTGTITFTGSNGVNVHCSSGHLIVALTANTGSQIKGTVPVGGAKFTGTGANGDCTATEPLGDTAVTVNSELCFETVPGTDKVKITGCAGKVTFTLTSTGLGIGCKYEGNVENGATFNTNAPATVNLVSGSPAAGADIPGEAGNSFFCPSGVTLDMDFDFYTTSGVQTTIS